jgi:hypothetical protein
MAKKKGNTKKKAKSKGGKKGDLMNTAKMTGMEIAVMTGGVIAAQKFGDFKTIFKDQYAKDPNAFLFKHEGLIKVGAAIFAYHNSKNASDIVKQLIIGVGIQGAIVQVRAMTKDSATGKSIVDQIGAEGYDEAMNALSEEVKNLSVAEQNRTTVSGPEQVFDSNTSVSGVSSVGMGVDDTDNY